MFRFVLFEVDDFKLGDYTELYENYGVYYEPEN